MARHSNRGLDGRFSTAIKNTPEATAADFDTYADGVPMRDASADDLRPGMQRPRYAPSGDNIDGPTGGPRHVALIDAQSGQHLGTVTEDALRPLIGRRNGNLGGRLSGEHDALGYIATGI
jgi:hypothetical protein